MEVETLIAEMKKVKIDNPTLELHEILRIFNIQALKELTVQIRRLVANAR